jgi:hypothetical protein
MRAEKVVEDQRFTPAANGALVARVHVPERCAAGRVRKRRAERVADG